MLLFSYLHRSDATNTGKQHPSLPRGSSAQLEEALLCVPAFPAAEQWTLERVSSSLLRHRGELAQNTSQCLTLCKSSKWAPLIVDLRWGRGHEFCRTVPRTPDGIVAFLKWAKDGEWDLLLLITPMQVCWLQQGTGWKHLFYHSLKPNSALQHKKSVHG